MISGKVFEKIILNLNTRFVSFLLLSISSVIGGCTIHQIPHRHLPDMFTGYAKEFLDINLRSVDSNEAVYYHYMYFWNGQKIYPVWEKIKKDYTVAGINHAKNSIVPLNNVISIYNSKGDIYQRRFYTNGCLNKVISFKLNSDDTLYIFKFNMKYRNQYKAVYIDFYSDLGLRHYYYAISNGYWRYFPADTVKDY